MREVIDRVGGGAPVYRFPWSRGALALEKFWNFQQRTIYNDLAVTIIFFRPVMVVWEYQSRT